MDNCIGLAVVVMPAKGKGSKAKDQKAKEQKPAELTDEAVVQTEPEDEKQPQA